MSRLIVVTVKYHENFYFFRFYLEKKKITTKKSHCHLGFRELSE
jgi:hypothetical protein